MSSGVVSYPGKEPWLLFWSYSGVILGELSPLGKGSSVGGGEFPRATPRVGSAVSLYSPQPIFPVVGDLGNAR